MLVEHPSEIERPTSDSHPHPVARPAQLALSRQFRLSPGESQNPLVSNGINTQPHKNLALLARLGGDVDARVASASYEASGIWCLSTMRGRSA